MRSETRPQANTDITDHGQSLRAEAAASENYQLTDVEFPQAT